jgi:hypothetical protein
VVLVERPPVVLTERPPVAVTVREDAPMAVVAVVLPGETVAVSVPVPMPQ